jgi:ubiquinone/menaquinone biosynthesis C-methylase UbiE
MVRLDLQSAYGEQYAEDMTAWRELGAKYKAQNIVAVCRGRSFANVLECGAGEGSILYHLDAIGFCRDMHALEISRSGLEAIRRRDLPSVRSALQFNGYTLPYRDKSFELAILSHVLEHVEHPRLLLRELKRVSQHQVVEVPLDYSPLVDRRVGDLLGYGHLNIFTPALLRFLLRSEGYVVLAERYDPGHVELAAFQQERRSGRPSTLGARLRRRAVAGLLGVRRLLTPVDQRRELRYHAYCVLCGDGGAAPVILAGGATGP